ncbi:ATPdependent RNA helicase [Saguinus oedipus]|uniref:ATPdependent RNA helicase n=1 Tax=Saguinus oedipus TaxID=9490 RepID=A0ABQ9VNZ3_SAGOE|nr:ATPdependent RNA helicase [Saguinus oedipus]
MAEQNHVGLEAGPERSPGPGSGSRGLDGGGGHGGVAVTLQDPPGQRLLGGHAPRVLGASCAAGGMAVPVGPVKFWRPGKAFGGTLVRCGGLTSVLALGPRRPDLGELDAAASAGTEGPGVSISEERQSLAENSGTTVVYNPYASLSIEQQRQKLPVFKLRNHILYLIENYQTVVIVGETGCGKSTQIPQYLAEAGWTAEGRVVGVTQPRRVAAVTVAGRVAEERGAVLGHEVGYCIRFDDCTDQLATRIKGVSLGRHQFVFTASSSTVLVVQAQRKWGLANSLIINASEIPLKDLQLS